jgi:acetate kinase
MDQVILIANPGSASRKYGLYQGEALRATLHFEHLDGKMTCTLGQAENTREIPVNITDLSDSSNQILSILQFNNVLRSDEKISYVGVRIVAPSDYFLRDMVIDNSVVDRLKSLEVRAPLHIRATMQEITSLKQNFVDAKIVGISDSAFHITKPDYAWGYGLPVEDAAKLEVKRYGYHGISMAAATNVLSQTGNLVPKMIICHLGSGASLTAIKDGKSVDNTMGYSPLEGLIMATRSGTIDPTAVGVLRDALGLDNTAMEYYLNTKGGLLGLSGISSEIPELLKLEAQDNPRAHFAMETYLYNVKKAVGQMSGALGGADGLVFTGTVGERAVSIRERIVSGLEYLGFTLDKDMNNQCQRPTQLEKINTQQSKPILVIPTDESAEMCRRVIRLIK